MPRTKLNPTVSRPRKVKAQQPKNIYSIAFFAQQQDSFPIINTEWLCVTQYSDDGEPFYVRPLIKAAVSGIYPHKVEQQIVDIDWYTCAYPDGEINQCGDKLVSEEFSPQEIDEYYRGELYEQNGIDASVWDDIIDGTWRRSRKLAHYKCRAHNYLIERFELNVVQVLKCKVFKGKVFVTYLFDTGKKGSTILSQEKLDINEDENYITYIPIPSAFWLETPWAQQYGHMMFDCYQIKVNLRTVGYVLPYVDGYLFTNKLGLKREPGVKPELQLDYKNYRYFLSDNIYDAIFSVDPNNPNGTMEISSTIFSDKYSQSLSKNAKGFGHFTKKREQEEKLMYDMFGRPTAHNTIDRPLYEDYELEETEE